MLPEAFLTLLFSTCIWAIKPLPPILLVGEPFFSQMLEAVNLPKHSLAFTTWFEEEGKPPISPVIYLGPKGRTLRILCHELRHTKEGFWHLTHNFTMKGFY